MSVITVIGISIFLLRDSSKPAPKIELSEDQKYYIGDKVIGLSPRKGYIKSGIAGVYYRNLPLTIIGKFNGYAIAETNNSHDDYAIAIYNDNAIHLGFMPGGSAKLHKYILENERKVHAYGYIGCDGRGSMYGEVCVENDHTQVTKRNRPYKID